MLCFPAIQAENARFLVIWEYAHGTNPDAVQSQGSWGGKGPQTPSQGKRSDTARNHAPAPVKPCPGAKRSAQGFSGSPVDGTTSKSIKDTKKDFKRMFFLGQ